MWRWTFVQDRIFRPWDVLSVWSRRIERVGRSHSDKLNWARRRTFHELNSLSLVRLKKSSSLALGLIETKNRTLKYLKRDHSTVRSIKNVAVLTEDEAFDLFFRRHPGNLTAQESPPPGICHPRQKNANTRAREGGGGLDAAGIDWCISLTLERL